jgi:hypothetical protein
MKNFKSYSTTAAASATTATTTTTFSLFTFHVKCAEPKKPFYIQKTILSFLEKTR